VAKCQKLQRKNRKVCRGDLDTEIIVQTRATDTALNDNETQQFTTLISTDAMVETLRGVFVVDQVNGGDQEATHRFTIDFPDKEVSGENWVLSKSKRYRILDQQDYEESGEFLALMCTERGIDTKAASGG
jgi:head-tail adaptor